MHPGRRAVPAPARRRGARRRRPRGGLLIVQGILTGTSAARSGSAARLVRKTRDDDEAVDFTLQEGAQERRIIAEDHAPIRLTARTEHVGMGKHAIAAEHIAAADRNEPN